MPPRDLILAAAAGLRGDPDNPVNLEWAVEALVAWLEHEAAGVRVDQHAVRVAGRLLGVPDTELGRQPARRGPCSVCGGTFDLTKAGVLRHHNGDVYVGGWRQVCDGVGQPPKESTGGQ